MGEHVLKCWPVPFDAIVAGIKHHEIRRNDRNFVRGDTLRLQEWTPAGESYTGRERVVRVTYVTPGDTWDLPAHLCVMSIESEAEPMPSAACSACSAGVVSVYHENGAACPKGQGTTEETIESILDAVEAVIEDGEIDFDDVTTPEKAKESALEVVAHVRDQLCDQAYSTVKRRPRAAPSSGVPAPDPELRAAVRAAERIALRDVASAARVVLENIEDAGDEGDAVSILRQALDRAAPFTADQKGGSDG